MLFLSGCRYRGTSQEYTRFSKAMDLPQQRERMTVDGLGDIGVGKWKKSVDKEEKSGIINTDIYYAGLFGKKKSHKGRINKKDLKKLVGIF